MAIRKIGKCTIREVDGSFVILTNVNMDEDLPAIGEIVEAGGNLWKVNGISFHVGSEEGDIGLRGGIYKIRIE